MAASALNRTSDRCVCMTAVRPSVCPAVIPVQIGYGSAECGTAALGCMRCLSGTSGVDRLGHPCKMALAEVCRQMCASVMCAGVEEEMVHIERERRLCIV